jgi:hypothetical protein
MASIGVTITPIIAFKGQSFRVYLNQADSIAYLPQLAINDTVYMDTGSTPAYGYISSIDLYGNSFLATPYMPSDVPGYMPIGTDVQINNP